MSETLIKIDNVSKKFCKDLKTSLWYGLKDLTDEITGRIKPEHCELREKEFWAVKNINLEVKRGECLGLIGRNGAGKSTMLKMLNGLIKPDTGSIEMHGNISALIELGAGFSPILTGRENIYNSASLRGLSRKEIDKKLDSIIEFSELKDFLDTPVQYYSSGMKVRLGFSVAIHLEPDILLIDEVLAVGDMGFVLKCFNKMDELRSKTAIIFVSHNMPQVSRMCTDLILMTGGESIYQSDDVSSGITKYYELFKNINENFLGSEKVESVKIILESDGRVSETGKPFTIQSGSDLSVMIVLNCKYPISNPNLYLTFFDKEQRAFALISNFNEQVNLKEINGVITFKAVIPKIQFSQGTYSISIIFHENENEIRKVIFRYQSAVFFNVNSKYHGWAPLQLEPEWEFIN